MAYTNLSIDDDLFAILETGANKLNYNTVNDYLKTLITLGEKLIQEPFDYEAALKTLVKEAESLPQNTYSSLVDLPSFRDIPVARADQANNLQPSIVRARLAKMLNRRVAAGMCGNISRAVDSSRKLTFDHRTAVYKRR